MSQPILRVLHPIYHLPSSGFAPAGPCPSRDEDPSAGCSTPDGISSEQGRGAKPPPSPHCFWCSQEYNWLSELQVHIFGSTQTPYLPVSSSLSLEDCPQSVCFHLQKKVLNVSIFSLPYLSDATMRLLSTFKGHGDWGMFLVTGKVTSILKERRRSKEMSFVDLTSVPVKSVHQNPL